MGLKFQQNQINSTLEQIFPTLYSSKPNRLTIRGLESHLSSTFSYFIDKHIKSTSLSSSRIRKLKNLNLEYDSSISSCIPKKWIEFLMNPSEEYSFYQYSRDDFPPPIEHIPSDIHYLFYPDNGIESGIIRPSPIVQLDLRLSPRNSSLVSNETFHSTFPNTITGLRSNVTVTGNCAVYSGKWCFQVMIESTNNIYIGWSSNNCVFSQAYGVGQTPGSYSYSGSNSTKRHVSTTEIIEVQSRWKKGDIVTCCIDLSSTTSSSGSILYYLNEIPLGNLFENVPKGKGVAYYPTITLQNGSRVMVNFGDRPLKFQPYDFLPLQSPVSPPLCKFFFYCLESMHKLSTIDLASCLVEGSAFSLRHMISSTIVKTALHPLLESPYLLSLHFLPFYIKCTESQRDWVISQFEMYLDDFCWNHFIHSLFDDICSNIKSSRMAIILRPWDGCHSNTFSLSKKNRSGVQSGIQSGGSIPSTSSATSSSKTENTWYKPLIPRIPPQCWQISPEWKQQFVPASVQNPFLIFNSSLKRKRPRKSTASQQLHSQLSTISLYLIPLNGATVFLDCILSLLRIPQVFLTWFRCLNDEPLNMTLRRLFSSFAYSSPPSHLNPTLYSPQTPPNVYGLLNNVFIFNLVSPNDVVKTFILNPGFMISHNPLSINKKFDFDSLNVSSSENDQMFPVGIGQTEQQSFSDDDDDDDDDENLHPPQVSHLNPPTRSRSHRTLLISIIEKIQKQVKNTLKDIQIDQLEFFQVNLCDSEIRKPFLEFSHQRACRILDTTSNLQYQIVSLLLKPLQSGSKTGTRLSNQSSKQIPLSSSNNPLIEDELIHCSTRFLYSLRQMLHGSFTYLFRMEIEDDSHLENGSVSASFAFSLLRVAQVKLANPVGLLKSFDFDRFCNFHKQVSGGQNYYESNDRVGGLVSAIEKSIHCPPLETIPDRLVRSSSFSHNPFDSGNVGNNGNKSLANALLFAKPRLGLESSILDELVTRHQSMPLNLENSSDSAFSSSASAFTTGPPPSLPPTLPSSNIIGNIHLTSSSVHTPPRKVSSTPKLLYENIPEIDSNIWELSLGFFLSFFNPIRNQYIMFSENLSSLSESFTLLSSAHGNLVEALEQFQSYFSQKDYKQAALILYQWNFKNKLNLDEFSDSIVPVAEPLVIPTSISSGTSETNTTSETNSSTSSNTSIPPMHFSNDNIAFDFIQEEITKFLHLIRLSHIRLCETSDRYFHLLWIGLSYRAFLCRTQFYESIETLFQFVLLLVRHLSFVYPNRFSFIPNFYFLALQKIWEYLYYGEPSFLPSTTFSETTMQYLRFLLRHCFDSRVKIPENHIRLSKSLNRILLTPLGVKSLAQSPKMISHLLYHIFLPRSSGLNVVYLHIFVSLFFHKTLFATSNTGLDSIEPFVIFKEHLSYFVNNQPNLVFLFFSRILDFGNNVLTQFRQSFSSLVNAPTEEVEYLNQTVKTFAVLLLSLRSLEIVSKLSGEIIWNSLNDQKPVTPRKTNKIPIVSTHLSWDTQSTKFTKPKLKFVKSEILRKYDNLFPDFKDLSSIIPKTFNDNLYHTVSSSILSSPIHSSPASPNTTPPPLLSSLSNPPVLVTSSPSASSSSLFKKPSAASSKLQSMLKENQTTDFAESLLQQISNLIKTILDFFDPSNFFSKLYDKCDSSPLILYLIPKSKLLKPIFGLLLILHGPTLFSFFAQAQIQPQLLKSSFSYWLKNMPTTLDRKKIEPILREHSSSLNPTSCYHYLTDASEIDQIKLQFEKIFESYTSFYDEFLLKDTGHQDECVICYSRPCNLTLYPCKHRACHICVETWLRDHEKCFLCNQILDGKLRDDRSVKVKIRPRSSLTQ